jgi:hypothetical protein
MLRIIQLGILALTTVSSGCNAQSGWTQKSDYSGSPRHDYAGYSAGNFGYIEGGRYGGPFNAISEWQKFDPTNNIREIVAPMT